MKIGEDVADGDDEGRTIVSQNQGTAKLCNEELFLRTQNKYVVFPTYQTGKNMGGGGGNGQSTRHLDMSQLGSHFPANPSCNTIGL